MTSLLAVTGSAILGVALATGLQPTTVTLRNAAEPGMTMPLAGMGMPCGLGCPKACPGYVW